MPRHFVKIVNRGTYTSIEKGLRYIRRGLARLVSAPDDPQMCIAMLEAAEIAALQTWDKRDKRVENHDDGIERRYALVESASMPVKQLRPVTEVGTQDFHRKCKVKDRLWHPDRFKPTPESQRRETSQGSSAA